MGRIMKLKTAQVTNYRSVEDSTVFRIDPSTCLVGKNEAGKSALLTALSALNPHDATPVVLDRERDYPRRHLTQYAARHGGKEAEVIRTTWLLEDHEVAAIEAEWGEGALTSRTILATRHYGDDGPRFGFDADFKKVTEHLLSAYRLDAAERAQLKEATDPSTLRTKLQGLETRTAKQEELLGKFAKHSSMTDWVRSYLTKTLPRVMYFSNYDRMDGAVQVEQVINLQESGNIDNEDRRGTKLFADFFEYAGVPLDDVTSIETYETFNAQLQAASNNITEQVLEYWTQNPHLDVQVKVESAKSGDPSPFNKGTIARARVYNQLHRVDTPFSERSAGFVWFFSFLVKFAQVKDEDVPVVLALDEPGLTLHGTAQGDLLRFFKEKLEPHHQILYSTHSPFMVPADSLLSARVVEDEVVKQGHRLVPAGTRVTEDVLSRDRDTLFPLQGALGYEITQTLFIGKNTLLVEGPSDILYLKVLSNALVKRKRTSLSPQWTICPVGGIGNVRSFVGLFGGTELNMAVLADYAAGGKKEIERVRAMEVLAKGRVLTMDSYAAKSEADTEDLFEQSLFLDIVNGAYGLKGKAAITAAKIGKSGVTGDRLLPSVEAVFRTEVPVTAGDFDHYSPAEYLMLNPQILDSNEPRVVETLDRAERLFSDLNAFLP